MNRALPLLLLPLALAFAAPALAGNAELKKAVRAANEAVKAKDATALEGALLKVVAEDGKLAAKELIDMLEGFPGDRPGLYWQVIGALTTLDDPKALEVVSKFLVRSDGAPLAQDIMFGLQNNRSANVISVYRQVLEKKGNRLHLLAVDRLGELEQPESVDLLLEILEREDGKGTALEKRILSTLSALFSEDMGDLLNWKGWWEQNRATAFSKADKAGGSSTTGTVKDELGGARAGGLTSMTRKGGKVLVLRGMNKNFDEIEKMLARLEVKHEVMEKKAFMEDMDKALEGVAALILNCNFYGAVCRCPTCKPGINPKNRLPMCTGCDKHDNSSDKLRSDAIDRIKKFVGDGGSVFTEDFGLKELTSRAWPDYVGIGPDLPEQEVDYAPKPGQAGSPLLRGVFVSAKGGASSVTQRNTQWKVDNLSPSIEVKDPNRVTVLLESDKLKAAADGKDAMAAVALVFSPADAGGGKKKKRKRTGGSRSKGAPPPTTGLVLHVLSHFGKQKSKDDEFTLQNLLVNWLLEAQERYTAAKNK